MAKKKSTKTANGKNLTTVAATVGRMLGRAAGTVDRLKQQGEALASDAADLVQDGEARLKSVRRTVSRASAAAKKTVKKVTKKVKRATTARPAARRAAATAKKAVRGASKKVARKARAR